MLPVQSVLCPVDFSASSRRAFEYAVALAASHRARLTVVTVIDPLLAQAASATEDQDYVRDMRVELRSFVGEPSLRLVAWAPEPRLVVTVGPAGDQILEVAEFHEADLIVMGAQGLAGPRALVVGSVTERVLRDAPAPVLVVPPDDGPLVSIERTGPRFRVAEIVAGVDLRVGSVGLAHLASMLASQFGARLRLAHVVQPVQATSRWSHSASAADDLHRATAQAALEHVATQLDPAAGPEALTLTGHAADVLARLARERTAAMVVAGTGSGDGGAHRPGSTAHRLLCLAPVPVLMVPPAVAERYEVERRITAGYAPPWPAADPTRETFRKPAGRPM